MNKERKRTIILISNYHLGIRIVEYIPNDIFLNGCCQI